MSLHFAVLRNITDAYLPRKSGSGQRFKREPADATVASFFLTNFSQKFPMFTAEVCSIAKLFQTFHLYLLFFSSFFLHSFSSFSLFSSLCLSPFSPLNISFSFLRSLRTRKWYVPLLSAKSSFLPAVDISADNSALGKIVVQYVPEIEPFLSNVDSSNL